MVTASAAGAAKAISLWVTRCVTPGAPLYAAPKE